MTRKNELKPEQCAPQTRTKRSNTASSPKRFKNFLGNLSSPNMKRDPSPLGDNPKATSSASNLSSLTQNSITSKPTKLSNWADVTNLFHSFKNI